MDSYDLGKETADKYSLRGRVFNKIREDILSGKYSQREELKEATIGNGLGVSRTPVREALRQLELEGLVTIVPNKGAYVTGITAKDIQDIYSVRSYLEGLCARWVCENITPEQLGTLDEIVYLSEFHVRKGNYDHLLELDNKFHDTLYEASRSKILGHVLSDFHHYVQRVRKATLSSTERAVKCNEEHRVIVEAIRHGDREKAETSAKEHMLSSIKNISEKGLENLIQS